MGFYVLTDGNDSYIRHDVGGKYVPIRNLKQAVQFDSIAKANVILTNSIPKSIRPRYFPKLIETEEAVEKNDVTQQALAARTIEDDNIDSWLDKINAISEILKDADDCLNSLNAKLSQIDKEIVDIQHYIEFGKFNAYQGYMCFKSLQNALKQRRKYKDEIAAIDMIKRCKVDRASIQSLAVAVGEIRNKCYTPRALPELFRNGK